VVARLGERELQLLGQQRDDARGEAASMRWVRPDFTTVLNSRCFLRSDLASCSSDGMRSFTMVEVAATWIAEGKTSFDDWLALTSSFGCTVLPSFSDARLASTSLVFMFEDVPEPVW
jgi:hypothetical protein